MAYDVPGFSFDPSLSNKANGLNDPGIGVNQNPYVPECDSSLNIRSNYQAMTQSYAQSFGQRISYWSTGYNINNHNSIYGEDPTAKYRGPRKIKAIIDFTSYNTFITRFGIMSDLDIVIYIPIAAFREVWGNVYPLAGDLFSIDNSACDRPLKQSPIVFEVTEKHDSMNTVDFMGGHYIWKITARRYDNSYEPGAPSERFLGGPTEGGDYGKTESTIDNPIVIPAPYPQNVDELAKDDFNSPDTSIYGTFFK